MPRLPPTGNAAGKLGQAKGSCTAEEEAAKALGVEVCYITGTKEMLSCLEGENKEKAMEIELFMKLPFDAMA